MNNMNVTSGATRFCEINDKLRFVRVCFARVNKRDLVIRFPFRELACVFNKYLLPNAHTWANIKLPAQSWRNVNWGKLKTQT